MAIGVIGQFDKMYNPTHFGYCASIVKHYINIDYLPFTIQLAAGSLPMGLSTLLASLLTVEKLTQTITALLLPPLSYHQYYYCMLKFADLTWLLFICVFLLLVNSIVARQRRAIQSTRFSNFNMQIYTLNWI